jgi:hypothetical protein
MNEFFSLIKVKTAENDSTPIIYLIKTNDKTNELKLKATWYLKEVRAVTQLDDAGSLSTNSKSALATSSEKIIAFELKFGDTGAGDEQKRFVWQCDKQQDRYDFLNTMWKLSEQFLRTSERPKFVNCELENKPLRSDDATATTNGPKDVSKSPSGKGVFGSNQYDISKSEEDSLLKLMNESNFSVSNAEKFVEKMQEELLYLDTSNIESIMNSEENTLRLIEMLDEAVAKVDEIDANLRVYEEKINAVGDAVRIVGERDNVIQMQQKNQHALLELLSSMITNLEFSAELKSTMASGDLSSEQSVARAVNAANQLLAVIEAEIPYGKRIYPFVHFLKCIY